MALTWVIAMAVGATIIAGLSFYAGKLLWQVKAQKVEIEKKQIEQQAKLEKARQTRNAKLADSINLIARAMKEKQCEYSEGCLRIWVLISQYSFDKEVSLPETYPGVYQMYEEVKDMPTHESRKKYSKKEIFKMDKQRWRAEERLEDIIMKDCEKLANEFQALPSSKNVVFQ
jgi:predicted S18 family serine protease